jgi:prepilin-type processing-associated H-X9-DG protein
MVRSYFQAEPINAVPSNRRPGRVGCRPAFTFVELLIVVFIAVVVVGILLTVMLRLREKAGRAQCENHLRQIGVAVFSYRDHAKPHALPPSQVADGYATWAVLIAPYLEKKQGSGLDEWEVPRPYFQQTDEVRWAQVGVYYCPARRSPGHISISGDTGGPADRHFPGGLGDYACAAGDGNSAHPWAGAKANGPMLPARVLERKDRTIIRWRGRTDFRLDLEGQKTNVAVGEGAGQPGKITGLKHGTSYTILIGDKHVRPDDLGKAEFGDGSVYNGGRPASYARIGGPGHGLAKSPTDPFDPDYPLFGSDHPGGMCNFLLADGSVREISPTIDGDVLGQHMVRQSE